MNGINALEDRLNLDQRVRKYQFAAIKKNLRSSFRWDAQSVFATYMMNKGWRVLQCSGEADIDIAKAYLPSDIVVSPDSDFIAYQSVKHIWRPMGYRNRASIACYHVDDILAILHLTRAQLTAICVVTTNDYNNNVPSLGIASNYELISNIDGALDATSIVSNYLQLSNVKLKNKTNQLFEKSINVYIEPRQTPVQPLPDSNDPSLLDYRTVRDHFDRVCTRVHERRQRNRQSKTSAGLQRHKDKQQFNPFRTIDRPVETSGASNSRTRPRYSFKVRHQSK
ncbi:hypothetical protein BGW42_006603, partial [Actinomortierella wolfii]